jgi:hypothetical protein
LALCARRLLLLLVPTTSSSSSSSSGDGGSGEGGGDPLLEEPAAAAHAFCLDFITPYLLLGQKRAALRCWMVVDDEWCSRVRSPRASVQQQCACPQPHGELSKMTCKVGGQAAVGSRLGAQRCVSCAFASAAVVDEYASNRTSKLRLLKENTQGKGPFISVKTFVC